MSLCSWQVALHDLQMRGMPSNLLPGEPLCSPRSMVLVESTVQLLRRLHRCDQWAPLINKYIHSQLELIGPLLKEDDLSHSNPGQKQLQQWSITGLQMRNYNKCLHLCFGFLFYVLAVLYFFHFINAFFGCEDTFTKELIQRGWSI